VVGYFVKGRKNVGGSRTDDEGEGGRRAKEKGKKKETSPLGLRKNTERLRLRKIEPRGGGVGGGGAQ